MKTPKYLNFLAQADKIAGNGGSWLGNILDSVVKYYTHSGMTGETKETMDYENNIFMQNWDERTGPRAQLNETALGYDDVGLNRMMMAGNQPGATASSPSPSSSSADPLGTILSTLMQGKQMQMDYELRDKQIEAQSQLWNKLGTLYDAEATGRNITNQNLPEMLNLQKDAIKSSLNNDRVQRNLWRSGITMNEAKAALDRSTAWLNAIESRIKTSDANTRDRFNYLTNQLYYWSVESARVQGQYAEKFAKKQLAHVSAEIALLGEQKYGVMVNYLTGYENWQQAKFVTGHQNISYLNDLIAGDLKILGQTLGVALGAGKFLSAPSLGAPTIAMPSPTFQMPNVPNIRGASGLGSGLWTP